VNPAALTITANNASKTYGQTLTFAGTEFGSVGLQNGETVGSVTLASGGAPAAASVAGSPYSITASNATGGTFSAGNYSITYDAGSLTVNPAALTITADSTSKTYGQTLTFAGTEFGSVGLQNGETIGSVALASAGAPATANVSGSPYAIAASNATGGTFSAGNYSITYDAGALTVNPASLTITADNASKTYGQTLTFAGTEFGAVGLQNGETVGTVTLASAGAPATANVAGSPYAITASNATGGTFNPGNYAITYDAGALTVNPAGLSLSITADDASKTFGQTLTFAGTEFTSSGLQNGDTVGSVTLTSAGAPATANVGSYPIIPSNATGGTFNPGNYTISYSDGTLMVNPTALTITADNASKTFGQTLTFAGTEFTTSGLQNGNTIGSVTLASAGAPATANVAGSPYSITASNATGGTFSPGNYSITYDPGALTIYPAGLSLTITADNASKTYGQTITFAGTAFTSSGLQNGDTVGSVTLTSAGAPATANVGSYTIIPSNATGGSFNPGNYAISYDDGILMVNPAALTITANSASKIYGQALTLAGTGFTSSGLQNGNTIGTVTLASAGAPATANVSGSPYAITASNAAGGTFSPGNYSITYDAGSLTVGPAALTITADNASKAYGQTLTLAGTAFTSLGLQNGETVGSVTLASAGAPAAANVSGSPYAITASNATGGTFSAGNYSITYDAGALTVTPAILTAGLTGAVTKIYDGTTLATLTAGNYTLAGVVNGDAVFLNDPANGTYATGDAGTGINVTVTGLQLGGSQVGNYALASASVSGDIGVIISTTLTHATNPVVLPVGTSLPVSTGVFSGFVGGGTLASSDTGNASYDGAAIVAANLAPDGLKFDAADISGPQTGAGWLETSIGMGDFAVVYRTDETRGRGTDYENTANLAYASSFDVGKSDGRPATPAGPPGT
jgi:F0F1-type ATP synthase epsilon subunit